MNNRTLLEIIMGSIIVLGICAFITTAGNDRIAELQQERDYLQQQIKFNSKKWDEEEVEKQKCISGHKETQDKLHNKNNELIETLADKDSELKSLLGLM